MDNDEPTWDEVLNIMVDGGKRLCDYAIQCWSEDKYRMGHDENWKNIQRWGKIKNMIAKKNFTPKVEA